MILLRQRSPATYMRRYPPTNRWTARTTVMKKLMRCGITILLLTNLVHTKAQGAMSAQQIIDRMAEVYGSCRTYSDEGEVRTEYLRVPRLEPMHQPFSTAFVRPASFRFEFSRRRIVTGTISRSTFGRAP